MKTLLENMHQLCLNSVQTYVLTQSENSKTLLLDNMVLLWQGVGLEELQRSLPILPNILRSSEHALLFELCL